MQSEADSFEYVLYVDEAGDDGLKSLRPENPTGSSEWLCLAGYLIRGSNLAAQPEILRSIRTGIGATQGNALHYRSLSPTRRVEACRLLAQQKARAFVVCSYKRTLIGHHNSRAAARSQTNQWFYNFLIRLLLERVTDFCWRDSMKNHGSPRPIKVVFSNRGGHRYGQTKAYLQDLKRQAIAGTTVLDKRVIRPEMLRHRLIDWIPHYADAGLQLADLVASASFQALEISLNSWDTAPALALAPIIAKEASAVVGESTWVDYGFCLVPAPWKVKLNMREKQILEAYGYTFRR